MGTKVTEVRARLRVEDGGSATLDKNKKGFEEVKKAAASARGEAAEFARTAAAMAVGQMIQPSIHAVLDYGRSLAAAGMGAQAADQQIAGLITSVQGIPWGEAHDLAEGFGDALDDIAVDAHVLTDDVGNAFSRMVEILGASHDGLQRSLHATEDLAKVSSVLGQSTTTLAEQYAFMSEGALKTKSRLFQLLEPTGIFGSNIKKASAYWASLTEESRIAALSYGMAQVSSSMAKAEPTMGQLVNSMEDIYSIAKEKFGQEIVEQLMGGAGDLLQELVGSRNQIDKIAESAGRQVGVWVREAAKEVKAGYAYVVSHYQELKEAVVDAFGTAKSVVSWILAHKEELAAAFGAKAAFPAASGLFSVGKAIAQTSAAGVSGIGLAGTGGGALAGGVAVASFAAAVGAWVIAIEQWRNLMKMTEGNLLNSGQHQDQNARKRMFEGMIDSPDLVAANGQSIKAFEEVRAAYVKTALELGEDARAAGELADRAWAAHRAARELVQPVEEAAKMMDQFAAARSKGAVPDDQSIATSAALVGQVSASLSKALAAQNDAAAKYIADLMLKSEGLRDAFIAGGDLTAEGFDKLAEIVGDRSKDFAEALRARASDKRGAAATAAPPKIVMTGGQTFKIQQDFRDQDPDRVAIVFEEGVGRLVERRLQAGTSSPFGT